MLDLLMRIAITILLLSFATMALVISITMVIGSLKEVIGNYKKEFTNPVILLPTLILVAIITIVIAAAFITNTI